MPRDRDVALHGTHLLLGLGVPGGDKMTPAVRRLPFSYFTHPLVGQSLRDTHVAAAVSRTAREHLRGWLLRRRLVRG